MWGSVVGGTVENATAIVGGIIISFSEKRNWVNIRKFRVTIMREKRNIETFEIYEET